MKILNILNVFLYIFVNSKECNDTTTVITPNITLRPMIRPTTPVTRTTRTTGTTPVTRPTGIIDIGIPIRMGEVATLTYFTDTTTQCFGENIPTGNGVAINPLLLGFTEQDWETKYKNTASNNIPWCGKTLTLRVRGYTFNAIIIDTCSPTDTSFSDPNTGEIIGGKCDYTNVIDLYGQRGLDFLRLISGGDDFYQGPLEWSIN